MDCLATLNSEYRNIEYYYMSLPHSTLLCIDPYILHSNNCPCIMSYYDLSAGEDGSCDDSSSSSSSSFKDDGYKDGGRLDVGKVRGITKLASDGFMGTRDVVTRRSQYGLSTTTSTTTSNNNNNNNRSNPTRHDANSGHNNDRYRDRNSHTIEKEHSLRDPLWGRSILHLDVDCFYCQCEEIDRHLRIAHNNVTVENGNGDGDAFNNGTTSTTASNSTTTSQRPLAIGQKHIIVTCNYEARRFGVKKLQSRVGAIQACPQLMIVEGSDLRQYRRHSRAVYGAFRRAVLNIARAVLDAPGASPGDDDGDGDDDYDYDIQENTTSGRKGIPDDELARFVPARKGSMDEMMVDLSVVVDSLHKQHHRRESHGGDAIVGKMEEHIISILGIDYHDLMGAGNGWYIFGEKSSTSVTNMVEDQTGAATTVSFLDPPIKLSESRRNIHELNRSGDKQACLQRLHIASQLATYICNFINQETDFSTTVGVSVSPLLAKLASGLKKPKSINMLYPWRSSILMNGMPLRKMHDIGYKTMKVLEGVLSSSFSSPSSLSERLSSEGGVKTVGYVPIRRVVAVPCM
jgi:nucleotidyltransferase/DNA polymerase involved in DNA repair